MEPKNGPQYALCWGRFIERLRLCRIPQGACPHLVQSDCNPLLLPETLSMHHGVKHWTLFFVPFLHSTRLGM